MHFDGDGDGDFDSGGAWPDLTGDGRSDFNDFVLFAALSDRVNGNGSGSSGTPSRSGCGCALPSIALVVAAIAATISLLLS